jgi:hypothetical protein
MTPVVYVARRVARRQFLRNVQVLAGVLGLYLCTPEESADVVKRGKLNLRMSVPHLGTPSKSAALSL